MRQILLRFDSFLSLTKLYVRSLGHDLAMFGGTNCLSRVTYGNTLIYLVIYQRIRRCYVLTSDYEDVSRVAFVLYIYVGITVWPNI